MESRKLTLSEGSYDTAQKYVREALSSLHISDKSINEASLVFEELFVDAAMQNNDPDCPAEVMIVNKLGEVTIKLSYEGKRFSFDEFLAAEYSSDIISAYGERIGSSFSRGRNELSVCVQHGRRRKLLVYAILFGTYFILLRRHGGRPGSASSLSVRKKADRACGISAAADSTIILC